MSARPFSQRMVLILAVVVTCSFLGGLIYGMLGPEVRDEQSDQADSYSRSAIGHRGLVEVLRALDVPLLVSRFASGERAAAGTTLLLIEPRRKAGGEIELANIVRSSRAETIVIVLPKWRSAGVPPRSGWVRAVRPGGDPEDVLEALEIDARVAAGVGPWTADGDWTTHQPTIPQRPQVLTGGQFQVLMQGSAGVLIGQVRSLERDLVIVSDPDLLNNAGLVQGDNGLVVLDLLADLVRDRPLVIDETLHGFAAPPGVWARLFEFPLVLASMQVALLVILMLWAGMRRFGAAEPLQAALGRGRAVLVENTANLLWFAGHSTDALEAYWTESVRDVCSRLHAPTRLGEAGLHDWLARVGRARGVVEAPKSLAAAVSTAGRDGERILSAARRIHRWHAAMVGTRQEG